MFNASPTRETLCTLADNSIGFELNTCLCDNPLIPLDPAISIDTNGYDPASFVSTSVRLRTDPKFCSTIASPGQSQGVPT